ncbi:MAG: CHAD domain-containing protein [Cyanobacteria bacterium P01_B01_bin.77]
MKPQTNLAISGISQRPVETSSQSVGDYAHQAIKQYVNHICQQEKGVLAHRDPEFLHQMRIGLRRLRTVCAAFDFAIALPKNVNDRALKRVGKILGTSRDLDVLQIWLQTYVSQANLNKGDKKVLRILNSKLKKQRQQAIGQTDKLLHSKTYKRLLKSLGQWLKHPKYKSSSRLPMAVALPDIQLPLISHLLLHPGWLVSNDTDTQKLEQVHALRKQIKGVHYQMTIFREFYGEQYRTQIHVFKQMQDILGELQDKAVLQAFLVTALGPQWAKKSPTLNQYFRQQHQQSWQQWLTLRQPYLALEQRDVLYRLFLVPL